MIISVFNFLTENKFRDTAYDVYETNNFRHDIPLFRKYVKDILKGLVLLHSLDIIHNDMKPVS